MIKLSTEIRILSFLAMGLIVTPSLRAQLSGNYTLGGTSGASNFATWADFATELNKNGVSGKTVVTVQSNLTVSAAVELKQHSSNNPTSTNTLTIDGNGYSISGSLSYEVIWLNGLDYTEIKNLKIVNSGTGSNILGIRFSGGANDNTLNGCVVDFSGNISASKAGSAYVAFASSNTSPLSTSTQHNGVRNTVKGCTLTTSYSGSPGPTFAILNLQGSSVYGSSGSDNTLSGNSIRNFFSSAYYARYNNGDQFINNDISRSAANSSSSVDTLVVVVDLNYGYSSNRNSQVGGNTIHDLPFSGATTGSNKTINRIQSIRCAQYTASSKYGTLIDKNTLRNLVMLKAYQGISLDACAGVMVSGNTQRENESLTAGNSFGIFAYNSVDIDVVGNIMKKEVMGTTKSGGYFGIYMEYVGNKNSGVNHVLENVVDSCSTSELFYGVTAVWDGSWEVSRNRITGNKAAGANSSQVGLYFMYPYNLTIASNIIGNNSATAEGYGIYNVNYYSGFTSNYLHNTISVRSSATGHTAYGAYIEDESDITFKGNIIDVVTSSSAYPISLYSSTNFKEVNYNTFYTKNSGESWGIGSGSFSSFSGYKGSGSVGSGESFVDVKFKDLSKSDFSHECFEAQNNVPYSLASSPDALGVKRNVIRQDRGAIETAMDIQALRVDYSLPSTICAGYESKGQITVKNNFSDTIYNFHVAFSVNGKVTRQLVTTKILPGDTLKVAFTSPIAIPIAAPTVVKIYVDAFDDRLSNDTFTFKTTVKAAPGGGKFEPSVKVSTPNNPTYLRAKPFDITVVDVPVIYDINPPRSYTNSQYGNTGKWVASFTAFSSAGKVISGATLTAPSATKNMELQFKTSDTLLEDSTIFMVLKVSDLGNGCDTFIRRQVLIAPRVVPGVKLPSKICVGDTLLFENTSRIRSGYMTYWWDFGTGNPDDTTQESDPSFSYSKPGNYQVTMKGYSGLYGFVFSKIIPIAVNEIPSVDFDRSNACVGEKVVLVNKTTPKSAARYWDFGDGKGFNLNNSDTVKATYSQSGTYTVVLKADYKGCIAQTSQKAFVFVKPKAGFLLKSNASGEDNGRCENALFTFTNTSTIASGSIGSRWYMNSKDSSTNEANAKWKFRAADSVWVKLVVRSEFGCLDSLRKTYRVFDAPEVDFSVDRACLVTGSKLVNKTPSVNQGFSNFRWTFGDGSSAVSENVSKVWTAIGKNSAKLVVSVSNGCKDSITKEIQVLDQSIPEFTSISNACSGDEFEFKNSTVVKSGSLASYHWDFGDNNSSSAESPKKRYSVKSTTSYNVTLKVNVVNGCMDSLTKRIDVFEKPFTCDFDATPDYSKFYWGLKVVPKDSMGVAGGQSNVDYTFMISGVDTVYDKDAAAMALVDVGADGSYDVRMIATMRNGGNCRCDVTKKMIVVDRLSAKSVSANWVVTLYPNPANLKAWVVLQGGVELKGMEIASAKGELLKSLELDQLHAVELGWELPVEELSSGIYLVKLVTDRGERIVRFMKQ